MEMNLQHEQLNIVPIFEYDHGYFSGNESDYGYYSDDDD